MVPMPEALRMVGEAAEAAAAPGAGAPSLLAWELSWTSSVVPSAAAVGLVLAEDVVAPFDVPQRPCSRLDGYAVVSADGPGVYSVVGARRAGVPSPALSPSPSPPRVAVYVTTGAPLPHGTDSIVKVEDTVVQESDADGFPTVVRVALPAPVPLGEGVRPAGSDVRRGETLLRAGKELAAADVGSLLLARVREVRVRRRPVIGVLSTGDEIVAAPSSTSSDGSGSGGGEDAASADDRVWDANKPMLSALVTEAGGVVVDCGSVPDSLGVRGAAEALLNAAARGGGGAAGPGGGCDILITTGGVSMGDRDFIKPALESVGTVAFGRLCMKPGKPATMGVLRVPWGGEEEGQKGTTNGDAATSDAAGAGRPVLVFALPGNPVSAAVCFHVFVAPALRRLRGIAPWAACLPPSVRVRTADTLTLDPERPEYHRAVVWFEEGGKGAGLVARSTGAQASSRLQSCSRGANALLWLPRASGTLPAGSEVEALLTGDLYAKGALPEQVTSPTPETAAVPVPACGCGRSHGGEEGGNNAHHNGEAPKPSSPATTAPAGAYPPHVIHGSLPPASPSSSSSSSSKSVVAVRVCVLTVSDRCSRGEVADTAGAAVVEALHSLVPGLKASVQGMAIVPDDIDAVRAQLSAWTSPSPAAAAGEAAPSARRGSAGPWAKGVAAAVSRAALTATRALAATAVGPGVLAVDAEGGEGGEGRVVVSSSSADAGDGAAPPQANIRSSGITAMSMSAMLAPSSSSSSSSSDAEKEGVAWSPSLVTPGPPDLIVTTGGTGFGPRDTTPEATLPFLARRAPGLVHAMLAASLGHTPMAALSRYEAGMTQGGTLVLNLPGSPKAVRECLAAVARVLPHAIALARGE
jgi:gephyrin